MSSVHPVYLFHCRLLTWCVPTGYVDVRATVGDPKKAVTQDLDFLVDTGAFHTAIPKAVAEKLQLEAAGEVSVTRADKREVKAPISLAYIRLMERESILPVIIVDVPKPLIGVTTLEGLGLRVDPVSGKLDHARPFGAALL